MPESDSEPEKYSLDEMMNRLKRRGEDEGELVTREDGSQVMRVRKRKRRTNQKAKTETNNSQKIQLIQIIGFAVFVVLLFVVCIVSLVYSNSSAYRNKLIGKFEQVSGAKIEMHQFRMNPATANASKFVMTWPQGNVLQSLEVQTPVAKIAPLSFLGRSFRGEEIVAPKGDMILRSPVKEHPVRHKSATGKSSIQFVRYAVDELSVFFGSQSKNQRVLEKTQASLFPIGDSGQGQIRFTGGSLRYADWPAVDLDRGLITTNGSKINIETMRFKIPVSSNSSAESRAWIDFTGELEPLIADQEHELAVKMDSFSLAFLLGENLGGFFTGLVMTDENVDGTNVFKFHPDLAEEAVLELGLVNTLDSVLTVSQFRFLDLLARKLDDSWYELPQFDSDVHLLVSRRGKLLDFKEFSMEESGRMALRGSLRTLEGGVIEGKLRVGLPSNLIKAVKDKRLDRIFGDAEKGYRWLDLDVSGTGASPVDNFKEKYDAANADAADRAEVTTDEKEGGSEEVVDDFDGLIDGE